MEAGQIAAPITSQAAHVPPHAIAVTRALFQQCVLTMALGGLLLALAQRAVSLRVTFP